jgi:hypothetical protein
MKPSGKVLLLSSDAKFVDKFRKQHKCSVTHVDLMDLDRTEMKFAYGRFAANRFAYVVVDSWSHIKPDYVRCGTFLADIEMLCKGKTPAVFMTLEDSKEFKYIFYDWATAAEGGYTIYRPEVSEIFG